MTPPHVAPDSPGAVLQLIRSGKATSRSDLAKRIGVSASTAGGRVQALIDHGYVREAGDGRSHGGRRPRRLELNPDYGLVAGADLGSHHVAIGVFDICGRLRDEVRNEIEISDGPAHVLATLCEDIEHLADPAIPLRGIVVGLPGPVDARTGRVVTPSRMPGWHGADARDWLIELSKLPVIVDNDANLMALGEHRATPVDHLVFLKAGTGIGCGVIAQGTLHRGAVGAAGDISHLPVPGYEHVSCSCGRNGCLDAVASGAALVRDLAAAGTKVREPADVVVLAGDADPVATRLLREAGRATGEVLATIVNFFNPNVLVIGGQLSRAEPFVASIRSTLYERSLPMATEDLQVLVSRTGERAGTMGGAHLMLEHLLDPERVNLEIG